MNRKYRKTVIAGNWKMNLLPSDVKPFAERLKAEAGRVKFCDVVICAPAVMIPAAVKAFRDTRIAVGAQDVSEHDAGAFTGEISAAQLRDAGAKYVIIGHSERRQYHGETDAAVNGKLRAALEAGLTPIVCVGETLSQRETGVSLDMIRAQVKSALYGIPAEKARKIIIAYEPIWAIGTGMTATPEQAEEVCGEIRAVFRGMYDARAARAVTIQYGGSMNPANAAELLSQPDIDGGLIGGASLDAEKLLAIINAANQ
ncbi:MAG: triose-phosphate isomerase [Clostridiales bacterium]|nr:triose-phosphate isomerase [Clostridiales bacterium]